jgi:hypothetical protein
MTFTIATDLCVPTAVKEADAFVPTNRESPVRVVLGLRAEPKIRSLVVEAVVVNVVHLDLRRRF